MYVAFIEVIQDLWVFATSGLFGKKTPASGVITTEIPTLPAAPVESHQVKSVSEPQYESKLCYVTVPQLACLQAPQKKFDSQRGNLQYGESVRVLQQREHWSFVEKAAIKGWVETKYLTDDLTEVFPHFINNHSYDESNGEVKKLRSYLEDELLGGELGLLLQSTEYIFYRLKRLGVNVAWPAERPRLAGSWQSILRDKRGVSLSLEPKTGSILECAGGAGRKFLAYVESVTPGETVVVSSVGQLEEGKFESNEYTQTQWLQWKPVFISFT